MSYPPSWLRRCLGPCDSRGFYSIPNPQKIGTDVVCEVCSGAGRCSWYQTLNRVPSWIVRGVKFTFWGPSRQGQTRWHSFWTRFAVAFLFDLHLWKP